MCGDVPLNSAQELFLTLYLGITVQEFNLGLLYVEHVHSLVPVSAALSPALTSNFLYIMWLGSWNLEKKKKSQTQQATPTQVTPHLDHILQVTPLPPGPSNATAQRTD